MMQRIRFGFVFVALILGLIGSVFGTLLAPAQTSAANESFSWIDYNRITMSGGDIEGTYELRLAGSSLPGGEQRFSSQTTVKHKSGCHMNFSVIVTGSNSSGVIRAPVPSGPSLGDGSLTYCWSTVEECFVWIINCNQVPAFPGVRESYDNRTVNISGTRPPQSDQQETPDMKTVNITLRSSRPSGESPDNIKMVIKKDGATVDSKIVPKQHDVDEDSRDNDVEAPAFQPVKYFATFSLDPGLYQVCHETPSPTDTPITPCHSFEKKKFQHEVSLVFGESSQGRSVVVRATLHFDSGAIPEKYFNKPVDVEVPIGPFPLTIEKPGDPNFTVRSIISDPTSITFSAGTLGNIQFTKVVTAQFENLEPGDYKVCLPQVNQCKTVTKVAGQPAPVEFDLTGEAAAAIVGGSELAGDEESPRCETNGNPLTWILCPIFNGLTGMADWILEDVLQPLLRNDPVDLDPNSSIYKIWSAFRVYGNIVLLIALIVTVFGQVIGGGVVEAYTARKMLPRILLAAVLINLSIYIVALAVDISNIVGFAIADLIITPIRETAQFTFTPDGVETNVQAVGTGIIAGGAIAGFFAAFFAGGLLGPAAIFILLFVILPAVLALLATFITIIILHGLIFILIVVSPVAFALYCLPNTEQYFRTWWDWLFRALLVYPIIMVIFAIADVMSVAIQQANGL